MGKLLFSKKKKKKENPTPSQKAHQGKPTTQDWVPIKDITDNSILRKDDFLVGAVRVQPLNMDLLPDEEQHRIIKQLAGVLNGIDYNYVFYSIDRPVDLDGYINGLEMQKNKEQDLVRKRILEEDIRFAATMASEGDALDRYYFILHSLKPDNKYDQQVSYKRSVELSAELSSIGLTSHACSDHELRELQFIYFNPIQAAYERTPEGGMQLPPFLVGGMANG